MDNQNLMVPPPPGSMFYQMQAQRVLQQHSIPPNHNLQHSILSNSIPSQFYPHSASTPIPSSQTAAPITNSKPIELSSPPEHVAEFGDESANSQDSVKNPYGHKKNIIITSLLIFLCEIRKNVCSRLTSWPSGTQAPYCMSF